MDKSFALFEAADEAVCVALQAADRYDRVCVSRYNYALVLLREWRNNGAISPEVIWLAMGMLLHDREAYITATAEAMLIAAGWPGATRNPHGPPS